MVGIVVVSHSLKLAEGVAELSHQMTQGRCALAIAGGVDDPENPIGTDAIAVIQAIEAVYDEQGVLVLMDMGSALLSTEMALELISVEMAKKVMLCSAPIVEGTIAASVAAAAGLSLAAVKQEAMGALTAKQEHLGETVALIADSPDKFAEHNSVQFEWVVHNINGLHARPTAVIIATIAGFEAQAQLHCGANVANAKSLNAIAVLGVKCADTIILRAQGADAAELITAFSQLAQRHFDESIDPPAKSSKTEESTKRPPAPEGCIAGIPVCEGLALGNAVIFTQVMPSPSQRPFISIEFERKRLNNAVAYVDKQLDKLNQEMMKIGEEQAAIFNAHRMMLTDEDLLEGINQRITTQLNVEQATYEAIAELAQDFRETSSEYMQAREADVWDIGRQLMFALGDKKSSQRLHIERPSIVFAAELSPSNTAQLDPEMVLAICLSNGNSASHSAILARAKGIPTICSATGCLLQVEQGQMVCVDASRGLLWINPGLVLAALG